MSPPAALAGGGCAAVSFLWTFANAKPGRRKPVVLVSISTPSPSRLSKRKNYLRPKLLKTLTKIYPNPLVIQQPPAGPIVPADSPHEQQPESPSDHFSGDSCPNIAGEGPKESLWSEIPVSETSSCATGVVDGRISDISTKSVFKIGFCLLGAFMFQTICAVWVLGSGDSDGKDANFDFEEKNRVLEFGLNPAIKGKSSFVVNRSGTLFGKTGSNHAPVIYMDEFEMEKKIVEIREMAREARERERLESKARGSGFSDDDDVVKTAIEKEVDRRLVKLRKRLENDNGELLASSISYLNKNVKVDDAVEKDGLGAKEANRTLMFEKKHKFRSPQTQPRNKPKGFQSLESQSVAKTKNSLSVGEDQMGRNGSVGYDDGESLDKQQLNLNSGKLLGNNYTGLEDNSRRKPLRKEPKSATSARTKLGHEKGRTKLGTQVEIDVSEKTNGIVQESSLERLSNEAVELTNSRATSKALNSQISAEENENTASVSNRGDMLDKLDSSKGEELGKKQPAERGRNKKSYTKPNFWWLSLPYVLAILMRRGHDGEGPMGLFSLKMTSSKSDEDDLSSHVVAFEDRGDATNFCYILHSFFDDLGDFSADIVPLVTKELVEDVKSHAMKIVVVQKGQLQLYAGQPLADVETALRTLIK